MPCPYGIRDDLHKYNYKIQNLPYFWPKKMPHSRYALVAFSESPIVDLIYEAVPADTNWIQAYKEWQITSFQEQQHIKEQLEQLQIEAASFLGGQISNTIYNLSHLAKGQIPIALYAKFGKDALGFDCAKALLKQNISLEHVQFGNDATNISLSLQLSNQSKKMFTCLNNLYTFSDIDAATLHHICSNTDFILIEGYLWNRETAACKQLLQIIKAVKAKENPNLKVALTLSAPFVAAKMDTSLVQEVVDIIAGNDEEYKGFLKIPSEQTKIRLMEHFSLEKTLIYTNGAQAVLLQHQGVQYSFVPPTIPKELVIDVTGAGDAFLAAVLYGIFQKMPLPKIAQLAAATSNKIIQQRGARLRN